jgi:CheY-like chemotaxis protein
MKKLSDCRVLLVDDAKANLDILVEGLKADHKLSLALNGETALAAGRAHPARPGVAGHCDAGNGWLRGMPALAPDAGDG